MRYQIVPQKVKRFVFTVFISLIFLVPGILFGQQYVFHYFGQAEGLHFTRQTNMVRDKQGYLWIGSHNGLRRYDGQRFIALGSDAMANISLPFTDADKIFLLPNGLIAFLEQNKNLGVLNPETFAYKQLNLNVYAKTATRIITASQDADSVLYLYIQSPKGISVVSYDGNRKTVIYHKSQSNRRVINQASRYQNPLYLVSFNKNKYLFFDWQTGYFWLDKKTHKLSLFDGLPAFFNRTKPMPDFIIRDARGRWIFSFNKKKGIYTFDSLQNLVPDSHFSNQMDYRYVSPTNNGRLLFSAYDKKNLFIEVYNSENQRAKRIKDIHFHSYNIMEPWSDNIDHYLYISGNAGLIYGKSRDFSVTSYLRKIPDNSTGISVRGMIKIAPEKVMVVTERNGIYIYNLKNNSCKLLKSPSSWPKDLKPPTFIKNLLSDRRGKIYMSAYANTPTRVVPESYLIVYDKVNGFESYHKFPFRIENMVLESDTSILAAVQGRLYRIGLVPQIHFSRIALGSQVKDVRLFFIEKMIRTKEGILMATNEGLFRMKDSTGLKKIILPGAKTEDYFDIYRDKDGTYWIGTNGDFLYHFDLKTHKLQKFNEKSGFNSDRVVGILPEDSTHLWISTFNGVYLFSKKNHYARTIFENNGVELSEFNRYSYLKTSDKNWLFGSLNGFIHIKQIRGKLGYEKRRLMFSSATFRPPGKVKDTTVFTPKQLPLILSASERKITMTFGCLESSFLGAPLIYYKLTPLKNNWHKLLSNKVLSVNYLPPGNYSLQLTLSHQAKPLRVDFKAQYHLYEHLWFKITSGLTVILIITFIIYLIFDRRLARVKAKQVVENENFRRRLFTYIVHEFKTPLTVISGVSRKINSSSSENLEQNVESIQRQSAQMNELVEQMLELNQIDTNSWKPEMNAVDIPVFIGRICSQLQSLADEMEVGLVCSSSVQSSVQLTDISKLRAILTNLVSNAMKYSEEKTKVSLDFEEGEQYWSITVKDQGPGISESDLGRIFELFYKGNSDSGKKMTRSGVGLAYVKTAVEALDGKLEVYNNNGAVFRITFKISEHQLVDELQLNETSVPEEIENKTGEGKHYAILLVEDSKEIAAYVRSCFDAKKFRVTWKKNGREGVKYAITQIPDMVISDVRMPEMNGFELIRQLKKEDLTSHIPVIMLTALSGEMNRLKGLESGADAYIRKPFSEKELLLTVNNILNTIERQRELTAGMLTRQDLNQTEELRDQIQLHPDNFIIKANQCLERNYTNIQFSMSDMATQLNISRAQLNRKIKSLTGLTPSEMLRKYRLNRAVELLSDKSLSINEIAFACGFNDSSYFSKIFQREFGKSPSVYREYQD